MRLFISIFFTAIASLAADRFTQTPMELNQPSPGLFFDPHNHTNGVLNPLAVVNPRDFIAGRTPDGKELQDFWFKFMEYYDQITCNEETEKCKTTKLKSGPQLSNGTKELLNCNEPAFYCSADRAPSKMCITALTRNIYNLLSATPLTSFGGAYAVRRTLPKIPDLPGLSGVHVQQQATLLALAMGGIGLVEMSQTFLSDEKTRIFSDYQKIIDDLRSPRTSIKNRDLKRRFTALNLKVPTIKWLLSTDTRALGKLSDTTRMAYNSGMCSVITEEPVVVSQESSNMSEENEDAQATEEPNFLAGIYNTLKSQPNVVGVDVAGPEYTCFTPTGMNEFKNLAMATFKAAKEKKIGSKMLVVRAHVGEGVPIEDALPIATAKASARKESCEAVLKFPEYKKVGATAQLVHQVEARKNIDFIIQAIKELRSKFPEITKYVIFRLGHLTHVTSAQAKTLRQLGVTADINLSSNISTQAFTVDRAVIEKYLVKNGVEPQNVTNLLTSLVAHGAPYGEIFEGHGLKNLLANRVPVMLGTDGSGVEHSPSLKREYQIAAELIKAWNLKDPNFKKQNISINDIFNAQRMHFQKMGY